MRLAALTFAALLACPAASAYAAEYATIPGGSFASVLPPDGKVAPATVATHRLRTLPVTNAEFLEFVRANPKWQRDRVASLFADGQYLSHWSAPLELGAAAGANQPVTHVSWFAAQAFCESEHARLPTWYEFEHASAADATRADARADPAWRESILDWYSRPSTTALPDVGGAKNLYGVADLHGLVWEWVGDYASLMISGDNRDQGDPDLLKFCGAGALSTQDRENYAVLMRVAMLSALKAADTTANMSFRCAKTIGEGP